MLHYQLQQCVSVCRCRSDCIQRFLCAGFILKQTFRCLFTKVDIEVRIGPKLSFPINRVFIEKRRSRGMVSFTLDIMLMNAIFLVRNLTSNGLEVKHEGLCF
ncbi:hypothetical protein TNCT_362921 [Trichonephila clavata]|uniref:Uncharacterized protein n=1 Tax=Trichonephila clavata TaxID=2740835 RepID=A0A8X6JSN4_TRICU|nr:hypothetical protein TNCT_362921 [Trichonephila clavata]